MPSLSARLNIWVKIAIDFILLVIVALPILIFYLVGVPFQRGFFCNDESIRYPFKHSTVTSGVLYAFGTLIPVSFIAIIEYFYVRQNERSSVSQEKIRKWMFSLYHFIGLFLFGCAISHFSVDICKFSIGRLRPHFIAVCDPDWSKVDCSNAEQNEQYITEDVCTPENNDQVDLIKEARLSFLSGHASFSTYTMLYLIYYLQYRLVMDGFHLVRPVLQFMCFGLALFTCLSRVSDYKHHPLDVLAGFLNGLFFSLFVFFWLAKSRITNCNNAGNSNDVQMQSLNKTHGSRESA